MSEPVTALNRRDAATAAGLALLMLLCGSLRMAPGVCGSFHDDAIYVSTASALAHGQGYRLVDVPGEPLQTKYPVLYPAVLSVVWRSAPNFPANVWLMQSVTLALAPPPWPWRTCTWFALDTSRAPLPPARASSARRRRTSSTSPCKRWRKCLLHCAPSSRCGAWNRCSPGTTRAASSSLPGALRLALPFLCRTIGVTVIVAGLGVLHCKRRPLRWYLSWNRLRGAAMDLLEPGRARHLGRKPRRWLLHRLPRLLVEHGRRDGRARVLRRTC